MPTDKEEQAERRRTLLNDARVREQSRNGDIGTYLSHARMMRLVAALPPSAMPKLLVQAPYQNTRPHPPRGKGQIRSAMSRQLATT